MLIVSTTASRRQAPNPPESASNEGIEDNDWDVFSAEVGRWRIHGRLLERDAASFRMELRVSDDEGRAAPEDMSLSAFIEMPGRPIAPVKPRVRATETGVYTIEGAATASGLWQMSIVLPDDLLHVRLPLK